MYVYFSLFCRIEKLPHSGGRRRVFSEQQGQIIVNMVLENDVIRLKEIQQRITEDHDAFQNIESVSLTTIDRVLKRHRIKMKQVTKVPYERNL